MAYIAELSSRLAFTARKFPKVDALGLQQSLIERGEVQSLGAVLFRAQVATATNEIGFGGVAKFLDLVQ